MTTLYNITEAREKLAKIGSDLKSGHSAYFLKNGKILFVGISPFDYQEFQEFQRQQKIKEWEKSLPEMKISKEEARSIAEARQEALKNKDKPLTAQELLNLL